MVFCSTPTFFAIVVIAQDPLNTFALLEKYALLAERNMKISQ